MYLDDERPDPSRPLEQIGANKDIEEAILSQEDVVSATEFIGHVQADAPRGVVAVVEQVAKRDQVDMVIAVHVTDHEGSDGRGLAMREERRERALAQIQQDGGTVTLEKIRG
jgi:hypothetical protein